MAIVSDQFVSVYLCDPATEEIFRAEHGAVISLPTLTKFKICFTNHSISSRVFVIFNVPGHESVTLRIVPRGRLFLAKHPVSGVEFRNEIADVSVIKCVSFLESASRDTKIFSTSTLNGTDEDLREDGFLYGDKNKNRVVTLYIYVKSSHLPYE